jgi:PAS domain S-box-containing protein
MQDGQNLAPSPDGRVQTQEALQGERDFISAVLDTAGSLVVVLDCQGHVVRFNRACERITGYSFDEVRGRLLWELFLVPEEVEPVKAVFDELRAGQFPNEYENHWLTKDGRRRLIAWSNTALLSADGTVEYVIGTGIDITQRRQAEAQRDTMLQELRRAYDELELRVAARTADLQKANQVLEQAIAERCQAEEALRESEGHLRSLMESARNYGVYRVALDPTHPYLGRVVLASPSLKELLSISDLHDFATWFAAIHPDDLARITEANRRSLETGVPFDQQFRIFKEARGEWDWVHVRSTPVPASAGRLIHFNGLVVDLTEQKRAEQAVEEAYKTLEQRVQERTAQLAVLNSIAAVVSGSLDLKQIMGAALDKICEALGMEFGTAYGLQGSEEQVPPGTTPGVDQPILAGKEAVAQVLRAEQQPAGQRTETVRLALLAYCGVSNQYAGYVADARLPGAAAALGRLGKPFVWLVEDTVPQDSDLGRLLAQEHCRQVVTLPLVAKGKLVGALNLGTRTPRTFTAEQLALLASIGQQVGVAVDNARLYEAEQNRREEAERRRRVAEGMREVLAMLNSRQSLQETLDLIASQTCHQLGCGAAAIWRLQDDLLRIQAACGLDPQYVANMTLRCGVGGAGRALAQHGPIIIPDLENETLSGPSGGPFELLLRDYRTVLSVPLIVQDREYGAMSLYYARPREFSEEDLGLARNATHQVALAIENARLREQAEQAAVMQERGRLARELHDSVTQSLYSVTMYTEAAARLVASGKEGAPEYLRDARDTAQEALREMRLLIYQLRPPALEKGGLANALQVRLDAVERRGGVRAELTVEGQDRLAPAIQAELHQIAQEALNNTLKHAHARAVRVCLHFGDAMTRLEVQDDGVGFDLSATPARGGLGLPGMKERVQKLGGRLEIESAPGQGTKVVVEVPTGGGA